MRGTARRAAIPVSVDARAFSWDRATVAVLRHSTLAWDEALEATPLAALDEIGSRDQISLLGQFAAHIALLQFAGVRDCAFDAKEWVVVRRRGTDCRLVRTSAASCSEPAPALTSIQEFAAAVDAPPLDVLRRSWARADTAYQEIESRLRADAAADLRWLRASAAGCIASPGIEGMRSLLTSSAGRYRAADATCFGSLQAATRGGERVVILGETASPLERYSAIAALTGSIGNLDALDERAVVERTLSAVAGTRTLFAVTRGESFDEASRRVVDLLLAAGAGVWVGVEGTELPPASWFIIAPRLAAARELEARIGAMPSDARKAWIEEFVASEAFARYLDSGEIPPAPSSAFAGVQEPLRSYLGAVALFGSRAPRAMVDRFLERLLSSARSDDLAAAGIAGVEGDEFAFASDDVHRQAVESIPAASRSSLCRVAAEVARACGNPGRAASLLAQAGDAAQAAELFENVTWGSPDEVIRTLWPLPRTALSPPLACALASALIERGRYVDARQVTSDPLLVGRSERRMGAYAPALTRLERLPQRGFEEELLFGELLLLTGSPNAQAAFDRCRPATAEDRVRHGYHRALLELELGRTADECWLAIDAPSRPYFAARYAVYRAVAVRDLDSALAAARTAADEARNVPEKIDAALDLVFVFFCRGQWSDARAAALDALLPIDETQGDRAAGGILFLLAYLAADDGQCGHSTHLVERLRRFYGAARDEKRLAELEMLAAQIELAGGRFEEARRAAEAVLSRDMPEQIREAAALVADEIDWIEQRATPLRSTGSTPNAGLTDRHILLRARRGLPHGRPSDPFVASLLVWEAHGGTPPEAPNGWQQRMLFRAAAGRRRSDVAEALGRELNLTPTAATQTSDAELRILRTASAAAYPFGKDDFGAVRWRYATRNRLGQWHEIGSMAPRSAADLDRNLARPEKDWTACSDRELLYVEGLNGWSSDSRTALASLFRIRAEHHRLQRLVEEEPASAPHESTDGIVGESAPIRDLGGLIPRVAGRDVPVCVLGESGTGKELVARAIHRQSGRRHKPFTAINCAALPENLIESELFGHTRGAFTGAERDRAGLIETTDGGTLFLDEIGEMPLLAQAKLLRFLQDGEFRRVGDPAGRSADVRIIAATNRKLEAAVEEGRFREDLYYRIRGIEIVVPPLRDRGGDVALLAAHFLAAERQKHRGGASRLSAEAEAAFASYHWPGNVRELQNTVRAAHLLAGEAKEIELEHLPEPLRRLAAVRAPIGSYQDAVARFRRDLIERSLSQAKGNQNRAAAMLNISRQALAYQIRELGILVNAEKDVTSPKRPRV